MTNYVGSWDNYCTSPRSHELDHQAINFLSSLVHAGGSNEIDERSENASAATARSPTPEQLALLSTIVVHPLFTNRSTSSERGSASDLALRLLRDITGIIGPVAAEFRSAFVFVPRSGRRDLRRRPADTDSSDGDVERQLENKYAKQESIWSQAEDFWHLVGWALNCSAREPKRWERWKLWMGWFLDVLEQDWTERIRRATRIMETDRVAAKNVLMASMIFHYLRHLEGRNGRRRMMRAILATGAQQALNEFPEVWRNETRERKRKSEDVDDAPRKKINLEQYEFGDYGLDEDEDEADVEAHQTEGTTVVSNEGSQALCVKDVNDLFTAGTRLLGGLDAVNIRHRLMSITYRVALDLPYDFTHPEELFDLYTESIRPLPLAEFSVLASNPHLPPGPRFSLLMNHLLPLQNAHVRLKGGDILNEDQDRLARDLFPKAANSYTMIDNAKISLVVEAALLTLLERHDAATSRQLRTAVVEGVQARKDRAVADGRRKGKGMVGDESVAMAELERSSRRLEALLKFVEMQAGDAATVMTGGVVDLTSSP